MYESAEVLDLEASAAMFLQFSVTWNQRTLADRGRQREKEGGRDVAEVLIRFDLFGAQN